ncbi:universal stress protein [Thermithiobacillus plumbiphilus]|uniref:Universal stress protein n=1 Tax=Thermithiobacillus plumbiphilus TaxID=1729899 RepID=A0ABU9DBE9_9PROT
MYQHLLLSYDGSREGRAALRRGAEMAIACGAETHLLAVMQPLSGLALADGILPQDIFQIEEREAREILEEGVHWLQERGLQATGHLAVGEPAERILFTARELGIDLIVVGHRNQSRLARWWRGSVGATLLDEAPCSILIVVSPENAAGAPAGKPD